jgi:hypothetical protein
MTDPYGTALRSMDDPSGSRSWYARSEGGTSRSLGEVPHLVITPIWIGLGLLAARFLAAAARPAVVVGGAVAGLLALVALPFVLGVGADQGNRRSCRGTTAGTCCWSIWACSC